MGKRRKAREQALQVLFQLEFDSARAEDVLAQFRDNKRTASEIQEYCDHLVKGVSEHIKEIDRFIQSVSKNWRIERMALVDRNILRIAVFELIHERDVDPPVVIDEAIEITRKYSSDQSSRFINGILDAIHKKRAEQPPKAKDDEDD